MNKVKRSLAQSLLKSPKTRKPRKTVSSSETGTTKGEGQARTAGAAQESTTWRGCPLTAANPPGSRAPPLSPSLLHLAPGTVHAIAPRVPATRFWEPATAVPRLPHHTQQPCDDARAAGRRWGPGRAAVQRALRSADQPPTSGQFCALPPRPHVVSLPDYLGVQLSPPSHPLPPVPASPSHTPLLCIATPAGALRCPDGEWRQSPPPPERGAHGRETRPLCTDTGTLCPEKAQHLCNRLRTASALLTTQVFACFVGNDQKAQN